jgi:hypothetical protein
MQNDENVAWWIGANQTKHYYWDGTHFPFTHVCACGSIGDCVNDRYPCNCDASAPVWEADNGTLTSTDSLPVQELRFGGFLFCWTGS